MRHIIEELLEEGFKFVCVLSQGYKDCHNLAIEHKLELVNHNM